MVKVLNFDDEIREFQVVPAHVLEVEVNGDFVILGVLLGLFEGVSGGLGLDSGLVLEKVDVSLLFFDGGHFVLMQKFYVII